ncbi:hypothetical protein CXB51_032303 [Gossypium anomalum]|uniref:RNase H type-1 domain-containing protein n=1 Tax=Gossypium anomalum TaxID=47600 RepID=A0A8J6CMB5_9ROSI|nr:hypothetical protein CXB51_032303 [Gossypium anomalum]
MRWKTPIGADVKINFDAAFNLNQARSGSGVVARNALGEVLASKIVIHRRVPTLFTMEACACFQTLLLEEQLALDSVVIEGDSRMTIKKCESDSLEKSIIGSIIRDIQHYKHHFRRISFNHIPRLENCLAHTLAIEGLRKGEDLYLERGLPEFF